MKNTEEISKYLNIHRDIFLKVDLESILSAIELIKIKVQEEKKIITMGNGGSAHTASHYITDWNKMSFIENGLKIRGFCLADNIGLLTAYANDLSFDEVFSGQLKSIMDNGDLVICVSGSGNSKNIISALEYANQNNATTLAILGYDGGKAIKIAHHSILVPSFDMQICEDIHLSIGHLIMKSLCNIGITE